MPKILISWLATLNDFDKNSEVNPNGPTVNFHLFHYSNLGYEKHVLLYTPDKKAELNKLVKYLKEHFTNHIIEPRKIDISKVHEDLELIKAKSEELLFEYHDYEIDILLSTGSGIMKIAWYICHTSLDLKTRLIQILPPEKNYSKLVEIKVKKNNTPYYALIKNEIIDHKEDSDHIIFTPSLQKVYEKAEKLAIHNVPILIIGETGTGKEELAKFIYKNSSRKNKPFKTFNCSAFTTDTLLESRLFGHKKNSFTGANEDYKGIFEQANSGTVFLDEIGDINKNLQISLLRVLQFGEIQPIGGTVKKVDVRVIAATNKPIKHLLQSNEFRSDLFYRLGNILEIPSLFEYPQDEKNLIFDQLNERISKKFKRKTPLDFSPELRTFLLSYRFPGNFRELINIFENFYVFCESKTVTTEYLPKYVFDAGPKSTSLNLNDVKKTHIINVLNMFNGNKTKAAKALGISVNMLKKYLKEI